MTPTVKSNSKAQQDVYNSRIAQEKNLTESYKSDINLVNYLVDKGWQPIRDKHSRNWAALEEQTTGRKIIVHRVQETGHYAYKSFQDNGDRGTIINLVANDLNLDLGSRDGWKQLHAHLSPMVGNFYNTHESIRAVTYKDLAVLDAAATAKLLNIQPLTQREWLHSRHISDSTIDAAEFKGQIVQRSFETKNGYVGTNTAFPMRNSDHIVTLNTRNTGHNMLVSAKQNSVWMSNIIPGIKPREIVITENPIDALSHYQLHPPRLAGERLYVSTGGQPGGLQFSTLQKLIDTIKPERFILANDNDFSGVRFNIQYMGSLKLPNQSPQSWQMYMTEGNQKVGNPNQLRLTLPKGIEAPVGKSAQELVTRIEAVMNHGHLVEETKAKVKIGKTYLEDTEITVDIPNNRPMLIRAENLTKEIRQTQNHFFVQRSVEKDFNDDLKVKVDRQQQEVQKIQDSRPLNRPHEPLAPQPEWLQRLRSQLEKDPNKLTSQKTTVPLGPTGLPLYQYEKGTLANELPKDGAQRVRKETNVTPQPTNSTIQTATSETRINTVARTVPNPDTKSTQANTAKIGPTTSNNSSAKPTTTGAVKPASKTTESKTTKATPTEKSEQTKSRVIRR